MPRAGPRAVSGAVVVAVAAATALTAGACSELTGLPDLSYRGEGRYLTSVAAGPGSGGEPDPVVSGSLVVWRDGRDGGLRAYDLDRDTARLLLPDGAPTLGHDAHDGRLVWAALVDSADGDPSGPTRLELMDLSTGSVRTIAADSSRKLAPSIWADRVVWEDQRHGNAEIYLKDLNTGETRRLTDSPESGRQRRLGDAVDVEGHGSDQRDPHVSGSTVVWRDTRWGPDDIYLYDLADDTERLVNTGLGDRRTDPDISGGIVTWIGTDRAGGTGLYALRLE